MTRVPAHPANFLWNCHHPSAGYPEGVVGVPTPIPGLAFFPGGYGLWMPTSGEQLPPFPVGGVMVLGQDFHSESGYRASLEAGAERTTLPTWRNLIHVLDSEGIAKGRCFFTNIYMGLRAGSSATGPFPGARDPAFVAHCRAFLLMQLALQKPALIISLGVHVPVFLGHMSRDLREWTEGHGIKHLDANGPFRRNVAFDLLGEFRTTIVALVHPSLRHASVRHRRYRGLTGADAESLMIREALDSPGASGIVRGENDSIDPEPCKRHDHLMEKMIDQIRPGEPHAWETWLKILDERLPKAPGEQEGS